MMGAFSVGGDMSDVPITRSQFLRGDISGLRSIIRPPWSVPGAQFLSVCNRCGECIRCCGQRVVEQNILGYPRMNFSRGECTLCGDCATACPTGALVRNDSPPWTIKPRVHMSCLSVKGTVCRVCAEQCESEAIRFHSARGGVSHPAILDELCHGCGACVSACPVQAIRMIVPVNALIKN